MIAAVSYYYQEPNAEDLPEEKIIELFARIEYFKQLEAKRDQNNNTDLLVRTGILKKKK